jgi:hypothetical protein
MFSRVQSSTQMQNMVGFVVIIKGDPQLSPVILTNSKEFPKLFFELLRNLASHNLRPVSSSYKKGNFLHLAWFSENTR